jgi:hypothetical protein
LPPSRAVHEPVRAGLVALGCAITPAEALQAVAPASKPGLTSF